jgi:hypothetical protein
MLLFGAVILALVPVVLLSSEDAGRPVLAA